MWQIGLLQRLKQFIVCIFWKENWSSEVRQWSVSNKLTKVNTLPAHVLLSGTQRWKRDKQLNEFLRLHCKRHMYIVFIWEVSYGVILEIHFYKFKRSAKGIKHTFRLFARISQQFSREYKKYSFSFQTYQRNMTQNKRKCTLCSYSFLNVLFNKGK